MKIITFKYNKDQSAVRVSTLMSDETFARKDIYRLIEPDPRDLVVASKTRSEKNREYIIPGTWQ